MGRFARPGPHFSFGVAARFVAFAFYAADAACADVVLTALINNANVPSNERSAFRLDVRMCTSQKSDDRQRTGDSQFHAAVTHIIVSGGAPV